MSRFKYIKYAYQEMAEWMQKGNEEEKRVKTYIHRFLDIPKCRSKEARDDAKEILLRFAYYYTNSLITYCSDYLKDGMFSHRHSITHSHTHALTPLTGYHILSVRTTEQFKRLPVGKAVMVYFFSIDFVLGRNASDRKAYKTKCYYPKAMFSNNGKGRRSTRKLVSTNYEFFKRMLGCKEAVFTGHKRMLKLYEKYCAEMSPGCPMYWGDEEEPELASVPKAQNKNEASCADGF